EAGGPLFTGPSATWMSPMSLQGRTCGVSREKRATCLGGYLRGAIGVGGEALAAAAFCGDVGVGEHELLVEPVLEEIDPGAVDQRQAVGVDVDAHAVLFEH